ncbi:MAG: ATP-binding protein, partial [Erysipelotrichaceae bacterium]|nr:ATP-binding protein [Erysipelotrichaceae bacterium]
YVQKRMIDQFLMEWKSSKGHKPLIIKGARQVGKTTSIENFGKTYESFIKIDFLKEPKYKNIFNYGYDPNAIKKELSKINPNIQFIEGNTLLFFDEIQEYPDAITSLKFFAMDGRFDVICAGTLLFNHYSDIRSIPVGYKEDYHLKPMDFEEFLWALGYKEEMIESLYENLIQLKPYASVVFEVMTKVFEDYIYCGGMPAMVSAFIEDKDFIRVFKKQRQLYLDYEKDIRDTVKGVNPKKVLNFYRNITFQLAKENHKYQITKLGKGIRNCHYEGVVEWLQDAGMINVAYLNEPSLPLKGLEDIGNYRVYYLDHSLLMATLDEESKEYIATTKDFSIYNGAIYESIISQELLIQGYDLYFYRNSDSTCEVDFLVRAKNSLVAIEVKTKKGRMISLKRLLENNQEIKYGIKLSANNIGVKDNIITMPYFMAFMLRRFLKETTFIDY